MKLNIRQINEKDTAETAKLYMDALHCEYRDIIPQEILSEFSIVEVTQEHKNRLYNSEKFQLMFGAFMDHQTVGYVSAASHTVEPFAFDSEIVDLIVKKEYQNLGIGLKLLNTAACNLLENGYSSIIIYNFNKSRSNGFYRSIGGKVVKERVQYFEDNAVHIDVFGWKTEDLIKRLKEKIRKYE